jgi:hypothetical protein
MRMAANHFFANAIQHIPEIEPTRFAGHLRMKRHLKQQITQFFPQSRRVIPLYRISHFVGFLNRVWRNRSEVLFQVPGTTAIRVSQALHDIEQSFYI